MENIFRPSNQTAGGQPFRGVITAVKAVNDYAYTGAAADVRGVGAIYSIKAVGGDSLKVEFFSAGDAAFNQATEDGDSFRSPRPDQEFRLSGASRLGMLHTAMVKAGLPETELTSKLSSEVGLVFDWALQEQESKGGTKNKKWMPIHYVGREVVVQAVASAPAATGAAGEAIQTAIIEAVAAAGGSIAKAALTAAVLGKFTDSATRAVAARSLLQEGYLKSVPGIVFDGQKVTLG